MKFNSCVAPLSQIKRLPSDLGKMSIVNEILN